MNSEILDKLPAQSYDEAAQLSSELLSGGADTVRKLIELVGDEFGAADGAQPKLALHGLVVYASRPGADEQRKLVAVALANELSADHSDELKAFICRQLQLCARGDEISALAELLGNDRLCEPATQALLAIGCQGAMAALEKALPGARGNQQATIRQAVDILAGK